MARISEEEAIELTLASHNEADKNLIRRKNLKGKNGAEALKEKLRKQELRKVKESNEALEKLMQEDSSKEFQFIKYKRQDLAYGVMPIDEYVSLLLKEIAEEDAKNQQ